MNPSPPLSASEWLILQTLHQLGGRATLPAICAALPARFRLPQSSVRALLDRLHRRGLLLGDGGNAWGPLAGDYLAFIHQTVEPLLASPVFDDPRALEALRKCLLKRLGPAPPV